MGAFCHSELEKVVFKAAGSMLKKIGADAFYRCYCLNNVEFPDGLEEIGRGAFRNTKLESVIVPPSVRVIHQSAFCECDDLRKVVLSEGLEVLGTDEHTVTGDKLYGVFHESAVDNVVFPSTLKKIEYSAFEDCAHLRSVVLPAGLEYIGDSAFSGTGFERVLLPRALRHVGKDALSSLELQAVDVVKGCGADVKQCVGEGITVNIVEKNE